ncbi:hypothetical protein D9M71_800790 [compost metagenome]
MSMVARLPIRSSALFTACLVSCRPRRGISDMRRATSRVTSSSTSRGTTLLTMPICQARSAPMRSPRKRNSLAMRGLSSWTWAKYSTPGMPMRTTGSAK